VYVFQAKLPTFPNTWANTKIMPDGEVQYWSVATMATFTNGSLWDGVFDMQVPVDKDGYYTIVVSLPADRPIRRYEDCRKDDEDDERSTRHHFHTLTPTKLIDQR